jgi:hypothetical protein
MTSIKRTGSAAVATAARRRRFEDRFIAPAGALSLPPLWQRSNQF